MLRVTGSHGHETLTFIFAKEANLQSGLLSHLKLLSWKHVQNKI